MRSANQETSECLKEPREDAPEKGERGEEIDHARDVSVQKPDPKNENSTDSAKGTSTKTQDRRKTRLPVQTPAGPNPKRSQ